MRPNPSTDQQVSHHQSWGRLAKVWSQVTEPPPAIQDEDERRRSRLLASILIVVLPLNVAVGLIAMPIVQGVPALWMGATFPPAFLGCIITIAAYVLNRSGQYRIAAPIYVFIFVLGPWWAVVRDSSVSNLPIAIFMIAGVLLATVLTPGTRVMSVYAIVSIAGVASLPLVVPTVSVADITAVFSVVFSLNIMLIIVAYYRDDLEVRRRKELEDTNIELRSAEARLREAQFIAHVGNWDWDTSNNDLYWSHEIYRMFGLGPQDQKINFVEFLQRIHPDDLNRIQQAVHAALEGAPYSIEHRIVRPDGQVRYVQQTGLVKFNDAGMPMRMFGTTQDITERKEAELTLRASENRLQLALSAADAGVWEWVAATNQVIWSDKIYRLLGADPDRIEPTLENLLSIIHPEDRQMASKLLAEQVEKSSEPSLELRVVWPDGSIHWLSNFAKTRYDESGQPLGAYGIQMDITERKLADEKIHRLNEELEQRVIVRTKELEEANNEIRQFAYIVSHDLRAPLVNLKGFAGELRSALKVLSDGCAQLVGLVSPTQLDSMNRALHEDIPEALRFIESSVSNMDTFTKAILKLSRLGRLQLEPIRVDTGSIVEKTLDALYHQIKQQGVRVTIDPLPAITADLVSIEQIFGNLLSNALRYLVPGRPGEIEIRAEQTPDQTTFHVRDNGRGIAKEDMDKVFAPFRRAGKQDVPGEGMGLSYVQALVRRHGGRIWCDSEPGVGSTFSFTIRTDSAADKMVS